MRYNSSGPFHRQPAVELKGVEASFRPQATALAICFWPVPPSRVFPPVRPSAGVASYRIWRLQASLRSTLLRPESACDKISCAAVPLSAPVSKVGNTAAAAPVVNHPPRSWQSRDEKRTLLQVQARLARQVPRSPSLHHCHALTEPRPSWEDETARGIRESASHARRHRSSAHGAQRIIAETVQLTVHGIRRPVRSFFRQRSIFIAICSTLSARRRSC